jgi:hypothetical protein
MLKENPYDIVFITPETIASLRNSNSEKPDARRDIIFSTKWRRVIVDEGHQFASATAKTVEGIERIKATYRWVLSGTPMKNDLHGLTAIHRMLGATHPDLTHPSDQKRALCCTELNAAITMRRPAVSDLQFAQEREPAALAAHIWMCNCAAPAVTYLREQAIGPTPIDTEDPDAAFKMFESRLEVAPTEFKQVFSVDYEGVVSGSLDTAAARDYWERLVRIDAAFRAILQDTIPTHQGGNVPSVTSPAGKSSAIHVFTRQLNQPIDCDAPAPMSPDVAIEWHLNSLISEFVAAKQHRQGRTSASNGGGSGSTILADLYTQSAAMLHPDLLILGNTGRGVIDGLLAHFEHATGVVADHVRAVRAYYAAEAFRAVGMPSSNKPSSKNRGYNRPSPAKRPKHKESKEEEATGSRAPADSVIDTAYTRCVSTKMRMLSEYVRCAMRREEKLIVFDTSALAIRVFAAYLNKSEGIPSMVITGDTVSDPVERVQMIDAFASAAPEQSKVLFITLALGAESYNNLVAANHCIILTPWLDTTSEDQAFGRVGRTGQTRDTFKVIFEVTLANADAYAVADSDSARLELSRAKSLAAAAILGVPEFARSLVRVTDPALIRTGLTEDPRPRRTLIRTGGILAKRIEDIEHQYAGLFDVPRDIPTLAGMGSVYLPSPMASVQ